MHLQIHRKYTYKYAYTYIHIKYICIHLYRAHINSKLISALSNHPLAGCKEPMALELGPSQNKKVRIGTWRNGNEI